MMSQLQRKPFGTRGEVHRITPESAGWRYVGFSLYRLRAGESAAGERSYSLIEAEPCNRVRYAWHDATASEPDTVVTIDLSPAPDGRTRFRLTHSVAERAILVAVNSNRPPTAMAA